MKKLKTKNYKLETQKKPKVFFATDHAGFEIKEELIKFVRDELGYEVEDCGAYELNSDDDYPDFVHKAAKAVSENPENNKAVILGGSGQGEAMVANRYIGVRAVVYYGKPQVDSLKLIVDSNNDTSEMSNKNPTQEIIILSRQHNNANVLSLGARFISINEAKEVVRLWIETKYNTVDRHERRIKKIGILEE